MEEPKKTLVQRYGAEAIIVIIIASASVLVTIISFKQHTLDFEQVAQRDITRIEDRLIAIENRERSYTQILTRVDTHVDSLRVDIVSLRELVSEVLTRLPSAKK